MCWDQWDNEPPTDFGGWMLMIGVMSIVGYGLWLIIG